MSYHTDKNQKQLLVELQGFERQGISIWLEGSPSDSFTVSRTMSVREDSAYMRDYVYDKEGVLKELRFDRVRNQREMRSRRNRSRIPFDSQGQ